MKSKLRVQGLLAVVFPLVLLAACSVVRRELNFNLVFQDVRNLRPGQFLVLKGVRVGEVTTVDLADGAQVRVGVRVYRQFRETLCEEWAFTIEKPGGALDISGERQVTVSRRADRCTQIKPGAELKGQDSWLDAAVDAARAMAAGAWTKARALADKATTEFAETPAGRDLAKAMREFGGSEPLADTAAARLEAIRKQAEAQRAELERAGRAPEAMAVWERFEAWYEEAKKTLPGPGAER